MKFLVKINLQRLGANLSAADRVEYTEVQVRQWLHDAGFRPQGGKWVVSEADIGQVDPIEVESIEPFEDS